MPTDTPTYILVSCFYPKKLIVSPKDGDPCEITAPCGHCLGCYIDQSSEWSMRAKLELRNYSEACFLTLTYDDEHLPSDGELKRKDLQDFLKRLRRALDPKRIRFYGCGEYGAKGERPHYHLIIYGFCPDDLSYLFTSDDGDKNFRSPFIEKLWKNGFITVGMVTNASIRYCSLYLQKQFRDLCSDRKVKPFRVFSTRPPLGYNGLLDEEIVSDRVYISGKARKLPRSYLRRFESNEWSEVLPVIKEKRKEKSEFIEANVLDPKRDILGEIALSKKRLDFYLNLYYSKSR